METGIDTVVRVDIEHVLNSTPLRLTRSFFDFVNAQPVTAAFGGEEQHRVVHRGLIDVLDEVLVAGRTSLITYAAATLCTKFCERSALDIT